MAITIDTGYVTVTNSQATTIDLRGYTNIDSARIRWKGKQSYQSDTKTATYSYGAMTPFGFNLAHPSMPSGWTFGSKTVNTQACNLSGEVLSEFGVYSISGRYTSLDIRYNMPNQSLMYLSIPEHDADTTQSRHSSSSIPDAFVSVMATVTLSYHRYLQSTNPQATINGETTRYSGSIYDGDNSGWITLKGLRANEINTITHNIYNSYYVEAEIEYTVSMKPVVATQEAADVSYTSAILKGIVTNTGGSAVTAYIEWGLTAEYGNVVNKGTPTLNVSFTHNLTDIEYGTVVYYRAYATNNDGTNYGEQLTFTTLYPYLEAPIRTDPTNGEKVTDRVPWFEFSLPANEDNAATKYHARIKIAEYVDMSGDNLLTYTSEDDQSNWELWDGDSWIPFPSGGVDPDSVVRVKPQIELLLATLYWVVDSHDGTRYGIASTAWSMRVVLTTNGLYALVIDNVSYNAYDLKIIETSNGQVGQITCTINNEADIDYGDMMQVAISDFLGMSEEYTGIVRSKSCKNFALTVGAITGSGILSERLVLEDYVSQDIGLTAKAIIDDYCAPLTSININTSTGISAPIVAKDKTPLSVFEDIRRQYGIMYYIDKDWDTHFYLPDAIVSSFLTVKNGEVVV